ncbi:MAG TPA: fibrobacter succinogenes major paralogous domain-containing protein [Saprospiraceae bacterium]|nr:fibrobacter succinogenes major paralogous domain-containing protein [Saprospiraceae bacterium]
MYRNYLIYVVFIASSAIILNACIKDEDPNPLNGKTTAQFKKKLTYGTMKDQDGNIYKTITIDTMTWMAENLRTTKYNDGTVISNFSAPGYWDKLTFGAFCNYNGTRNSDSLATFGRLYNWHAVNTGKLAPEGWHVATMDEWKALVNYLGDSLMVGAKLKEAGNKHWLYENSDATNETGFTALPAGGRLFNVYMNLGYLGYWWTGSEGTTDANARLVRLNYDNSKIDYFTYIRVIGLSVRCVKDR